MDARMNPKGGPVIDAAMAERLRAKFGGIEPGWMSGGPNATMPGPNQSTSPLAGVTHRTAPAAQTLEQLLGRELKVRIVNPQEIGGGS